VPETLTPEVEVREAQADTPRPRQRPDPQTEPAPRAAAAQPAGNSERNARRGTAEGGPQGTAAQAPAAATGAAPGNAQATNYPGEVLRRIQRVRQARVSARGSAVVAFSIGGDGGLSSVRIARASGSSALDAAALDHIRRAAPFPPPPAGAQRQFSFEFVGR
jgi:protein TonB